MFILLNEYTIFFNSCMYSKSVNSFLPYTHMLENNKCIYSYIKLIKGENFFQSSQLKIQLKYFQLNLRLFFEVLEFWVRISCCCC